MTRRPGGDVADGRGELLGRRVLEHVPATRARPAPGAASPPCPGWSGSGSRQAGSFSCSCSAADSPSRPGRSMSMIAMSGWLASAVGECRRRSRPPRPPSGRARVRSGRPGRRAPSRRPRRAGSSAMTAPLALLLAGCRGNLGQHLEPAIAVTRSAARRWPPAGRAGSPGRRRDGRRSDDRGTPSLITRSRMVSAAPRLDDAVPRRAVPEHVGHRLAQDGCEHGIDASSSAPQPIRPGNYARRRRAGRRPSSPPWPARRCGSRGHGADVGQGLARDVEHLAELIAGAGRVGAHQPPGDLGLQRDRRQAVTEQVVQVPGEPHPLADDGQLGQLTAGPVHVPDGQREPRQPEHHQPEDQRGQREVGGAVGTGLRRRGPRPPGSCPPPRPRTEPRPASRTAAGARIRRRSRPCRPSTGRAPPAGSR